LGVLVPARGARLGEAAGWRVCDSRGGAQRAREGARATRPEGRAATITIGELVDEYLEMHQAEPVTIAKLRWLFGTATALHGSESLVVR
jgi:hypothetical protein